MSLEVSSMGLLSLIFRNLKNCPEKKAVIHHFGLFGTEVLENCMHNFCHIRNICAHHGWLWNRRISIPITIPKKTRLSFIERRAIYPYKLYSALCAIVYLMEVINPKSAFKATLVELIAQWPMGQLKETGFPKDWKNENFWQWWNYNLKNRTFRFKRSKRWSTVFKDNRWKQMDLLWSGVASFSEKQSRLPVALYKSRPFGHEVLEDIGYRNSSIQLVDSQILENIQEVQRGQGLSESQTIERPKGVKLGYNLMSSCKASHLLQGRRSMYRFIAVNRNGF